MKTNGSVYVAVVFAVLIGYFGYQWWLNPARAVKRRLGEVAAALSVPPDDTDIGRITRLAQLRRYLTADIRIRSGATGPDVTSREAVLGAMSAWTPPPGGRDVQFVDVQISMDSESDARAYVTIEVTSPNPQADRPTVDTRDASVGLTKQDGEWLITTAELKEVPRP